MTAAITDADYQAAQIYADFYSESASYNTMAHAAIAQAFAAHRIQARKEAIEEAARVVDRVVIAGEPYTLGRLAAAIRALTTDGG